MADEVQTGFGRTGELFCVEHHGLEPDVLVLAKGLGSGFPISAIGASAELMGRWPVGSHGGTYGGNPIGCAAALATIDVVTAPGFLDNVRERRRASWSRGCGRSSAPMRRAGPAEAEVRGLGLMVALETADPVADRRVIASPCLAEGHGRS